MTWIAFESITTRLVDVPLPSPIGTAIHQMTSVGCVLVEATTADGVVGEGYALALNADRIRSLDEMITGLGARVVGRDATETEGIWEDLWSLINPMGHKGITVSAMSALDVALWDAVGRTLQMPPSSTLGKLSRIDSNLCVVGPVVVDVDRRAHRPSQRVRR